MEYISAGVQYDDFVGQVAADCHDSLASFSAYMKGRGLIEDGEFVIAINFYSGDNGFLSTSVLVAPLQGYDSVPAWLAANPDPLPVRKVSLDVSLDQFFDLFKRFEVVMAPKGLAVLGRGYNS
ncbi:hypothetical protein OL229_09240 [Neisseriaceae bacterium JH1-16]|nr:hypothetical protein [Neisseriaceae bacterium JH1-16]